MATLAIILDAEAHGTLIHDLPAQDGVFRWVVDDVAGKVAAFEATWKAKRSA